jgi:hypothetical protein
MVDCSQAETEALRQTFRALDIYYCSFHVAQAWERKAKELHGVGATGRREESNIRVSLEPLQ